MRLLADNACCSETAERYESPVLVELGTLEELTLDQGALGEEDNVLGTGLISEPI